MDKSADPIEGWGDEVVRALDHSIRILSKGYYPSPTLPRWPEPKTGGASPKNTQENSRNRETPPPTQKS